mgnify:CR=1 FL=1
MQKHGHIPTHYKNQQRSNRKLPVQSHHVTKAAASSTANNDQSQQRTSSNPDKVYISFSGPRHRRAADYRPPSSHLKSGPRVTVNWLKQRESFIHQRAIGKDHRYLLPANVTIHDVLRMFHSFPETIDGFLDKEDVADFMQYIGISVKSDQEVYVTINKVLGKDNDGLLDQEEIQKLFLTKPVYVPMRRDHASRRASRRSIRTSRNASRQAQRARRRVVIKPNSTKAGAKPFCNFKKFRKLEKKRKKLGHLVKDSGRAKGGWHSFPKYANLSGGSPYLSELDRQLMADREKKKRFIAGKDFHAAVSSTAKQREWRRILQGGGLAHGPYLSPIDRAKLDEKQRKKKFISGGFLLA